MFDSDRFASGRFFSGRFVSSRFYSDSFVSGRFVSPTGMTRGLREISTGKLSQLIGNCDFYDFQNWFPELISRADFQFIRRQLSTPERLLISPGCRLLCAPFKVGIVFDNSTELSSSTITHYSTLPAKLVIPSEPSAKSPGRSVEYGRRTCNNVTPLQAVSKNFNLCHSLANIPFRALSSKEEEKP